MQRKLSLWATQDKERKFYDLYDLMRDTDWMRLAHDHVAQNAGSVTAGCDGINMQDFDEKLEDNLQQLRQDLKSQTFEPQPVRRVYIPKANGKRRPLGIPAIRDRIVQEAARMVLEPIFEADFSQYSFGFRPNRCTMDAVRYLQWSITETKKFFLGHRGRYLFLFRYYSSPKSASATWAANRRQEDAPPDLEIPSRWSNGKAHLQRHKAWHTTRRNNQPALGQHIPPRIGSLYGTLYVSQ